MENQIILKDGSRITLSEYQRLNDLPAWAVADHFSVDEYHIGRFQPFEYSELLLNLVEAFRVKIGKPVKVGAGYRTLEYQAQLQKNPNLIAAKTSPHTVGMAFDLDTATWTETKQYVALLKETANELGLKIRLGYAEYWNKKKQTFVHVDVCPEYYAAGQPYHSQPHPPQWERVIEW
jgi:uncharacterized protein YcbK (DUF882 family)